MCPDGRIPGMSDEEHEPGDAPAGDAPAEGGGASGLGTAAEYLVIGFVFPVALLLGFYLGRTLGTWLGGPVVGEVLGVALGSLAAFYNLYTSLRRIERREAERRRFEEERDRELPK